MDGRARLVDKGQFGKGLFDAPYSTRFIGFKLAIVRTSIRRGFKSERFSTDLIRRTSNWLQSDGHYDTKSGIMEQIGQDLLAELLTPSSFLF